MGRSWLRFGAAGAFALAVIGYPILTLAITGLLAVLLKIEGRP
jgi:hypothetical protein